MNEFSAIEKREMNLAARRSQWATHRARVAHRAERKLSPDRVTFEAGGATVTTDTGDPLTKRQASRLRAMRIRTNETERRDERRSSTSTRRNKRGAL